METLTRVPGPRFAGDLSRRAHPLAPRGRSRLRSRAESAAAAQPWSMRIAQVVHLFTVARLRETQATTNERLSTGTCLSQRTRFEKTRSQPVRLLCFLLLFLVSRAQCQRPT